MKGLEARRDLEGPELPGTLHYLWGWWAELNGTRRVGQWGLEGITYQDIDAWARLTDRRPEPHEVQALIALDRAVLHPGDD